MSNIITSTLKTRQPANQFTHLTNDHIRKSTLFIVHILFIHAECRTFTFVRWPISTYIFYTVAHVRTHAPAAAALLCVSFCFVIKTHHFSFSLIGAYCDISLALPLSGHSSFNGRRRKKLTIFSKELIITFTKTGFMLLRNSFPSV